MANEIEIFGMRVRIVPDRKQEAGDEDVCFGCAFFNLEICPNAPALACEDASGRVNRHFERVNPTDENV